MRCLMSIIFSRGKLLEKAVDYLKDGKYLLTNRFLKCFRMAFG